MCYFGTYGITCDDFFDFFLGELPPKEEDDDEEDSRTSPDKNADPEIALEELRAKHMRELQVKNFVTTFCFVSTLYPLGIVLQFNRIDPV